MSDKRLTPEEDARDSLESYNEAMRAIGARVKAGAPLPDLFQSQRHAPTPTQTRARKAASKRAKKATPRNSGAKRNTSISRVLENAADCVRMVGFVIFDNSKQHRAATNNGTLPQRYLVKHYPHPSLYGGSGFKEAYISHNGSEYILEAKWQVQSGSVDEKLPYIWYHFLKSPVPNWIVWFDGAWWQTERGSAAVAWLRDHICEQCPAGRRFIVLVGAKEGREFFKSEFGGGA